MRLYFMGCLLTIYCVSKAYFFLFIYQLMWAWNKHLWSKTRANKWLFVSTSVWSGEYEQVLFFLHSAWIGVGPEQGSCRTPALGSKKETSLFSPFCSTWSQEPHCFICSLISFLTGKSEENKISSMFLTYLAAGALWLSSPFPLWLFPNLIYLQQKFEIKLGIMN